MAGLEKALANYEQELVELRDRVTHLEEQNWKQERALRFLEFEKVGTEIKLTGIPLSEVPKEKNKLANFFSEKLADDLGLDKHVLKQSVKSAHIPQNPKPKADKHGNELPLSAPVFIKLSDNHHRNTLLAQSKSLATKNYRIGKVWPKRHLGSVENLRQIGVEIYHREGIKSRISSIYHQGLGVVVCLQVKTNGDQWSTRLTELDLPQFQ